MLLLRFIATSSSCTATELSILLPSCLTAIKNQVIKYCTTVYERNGEKLFWPIKNSGEILNKLKSRGFILILACHFNNRCVDCLSWDGTYPHNFNDKNELTKLHLSPISLHSASSIHIPTSDNNFRDMLPTIRYSPLGSPVP